MPIYEYACQKCGREFEVRKSISLMDEQANCPTCQGHGRRLLSVFTSSEIGKYNLKIPRKAPFRGPSIPDTTDPVQGVG